MRAAYGSPCPVCGLAIEPGERIRSVEVDLVRVWVHGRGCWDEHFRRMLIRNGHTYAAKRLGDYRVRGKRRP